MTFLLCFNNEFFNKYINKLLTWKERKKQKSNINQSFEFFLCLFGLAVGLEYFGIVVCWCSISKIQDIYILLILGV